MGTEDQCVGELPLPGGSRLRSVWVVTFRGKPVTDLRTAIKRACKEVGIPYGRNTKDGFVFHDLRHTFNTYMRKGGVPESVIMEITGHSTRAMFDRYNTVDLEDTKQAVHQLQEFFVSGRQNGPQAAQTGSKHALEFT